MNVKRLTEFLAAALQRAIDWDEPMEVVAWVWWVIATGLGAAWSIVWFLIGGWISTLLQIVILVAIVYYLKYGWQRAPSEIWRRTRSFAGFFWGWLRARDPGVPPTRETRDVVRIVRVKEFGDINISTLLSLVAIFGCVFLIFL